MKKMIFGNGQRLSRRTFVVGAAAALSRHGLALGFKAPFVTTKPPAQNGATEVNIWVAIKPDDTCVIRIARSEMGQGTLTGLAQLVAEELECDWKKVDDRGHQPGAQSRQQARLGRHEHRRLARHPHVAGLCAQGGRRRAHHAAAGRGRSVEGAGRRGDRRERRHHARGLEAHDELRQGRGGRRESSRRPIRRASSSRTRRPGRSPASR